ncbi:hypothetical protein HK098_002717 [Nowakowskiella sp. JEL0407]|nr:hypothetical protein HK098_002717 [Nowakowskiella sp. JEL0407]
MSTLKLVAFACFVFVSNVFAQEPVFAPCTLSPALAASKANWDGAQIGLGVCGRECVADQNCYNCGSPNPLGDDTCLCKQSFHDDVLGCITGSGAYCAGQAEIFTAYHTRVCVNKQAPAEPGNSAVASPAAVQTTAQTTNEVTLAPPTPTLVIPTTTAAANTTTTVPTIVTISLPPIGTVAAAIVTPTATVGASTGFVNKPSVILSAIAAFAIYVLN